jgi:hypothetical protein
MSDSRLSTRLRMFLLAAGCAATLGLAACGGDDDEATTSSTTTPTGATGAATTDTGTTADTGDASTLRDQFNQQLLQVLTTTQGLTEQQAQCAIDALEESVSDEDLQAAIAEATQTGEPPQDLIDAGFDAGQQCAE